MESQIPEVITQVTMWTPEIIVGLVKEIAWPIVVLVIGVRVKGSVIDVVKGFFSKNNVTEVSAGTNGVTAKFQAAQQSTGTKDAQNKSIELTDNSNYEAIVKIHEDQSTEFSLGLYENIKKHIESLNITEAEKVDLMCKEASLLRSALGFQDISKVLFRSQFDLFSNWMNGDSKITDTDINEYFQKIKDDNPTSYEGWDTIKYMAYPVTCGAVEYKDGAYVLTKLGEAYVQFMRNNPANIDELSKL